ncbi:histidine phosphatase family protein [Candidatus Saccharibacteria bacterium]|nr:histidine phosphatase family protein [Candidatus Saccharibacteria bacterium]
MKITLVRHGQTIENAKHITMGQLDGTLSELGKKQAQDVAKILSKQKFDHIYSSDLGRCKQTTAYIIKHHKGTPLTYVKELREMNFGEFQGKFAFVDKWEELEGSFATRRAPGGENGVELQERIVKFVNKTLTEYPPNSNLLFVAHGGIMKALKSNIEDLDYEATIKSPLDNCAILEFDITEPVKLRNAQ